jgi:site-specific DNA recombinase
VSSESQEARGTIGSQLAALREKLSGLGHEIVHEYRDDGYSGARLDRPGLDAMRDAAELGMFEQVWCLTPDRLARSYAYQILITDELARHDVRVCYMDAPPLGDDSEATLLVQVQGVIAEYEKAKIAERNRRGRLFRARAGEIVYRLVPYGYRRVPRGAGGPAHLEICEPEAHIVREIFQDFVAKSYSMRRICRRLYESGVPSPTGNPTWSIACLSKMLSNPTYAGRARYNRHQALPPTTARKSTRNKLRPTEEWIEIAVPAIVSEDVFEATQRVSRDHSYFSPRRSQPDRWLLRRLVVCGHCGVKTHCQGTVGSSGRELRYYVCNRRRSLEAGGPECACPQPSTRAEELDSLVWEHIRQALLQPELLLQGEAALNARSPQPDDELLIVQLDRLGRRLQQVENERKRVIDLYQMEAITLGEFKVRNREVVDRHQQLQHERDELAGRRQELAAHNRLSGRVTAFAARIREGIDSLDFEKRQRLLRLLVEQVRVTGPSVEVHVRLPLDEMPPDHGPGGGSSDDPANRPGAPNGVSSHLRLRQPGFNQVQPGRTGGDEVEVKASPLGKPGLHVGVGMSAVVVQYQVQFEILRVLAIQLAQEPQELLVPVLEMNLAEDCAFEQVDGREQCRGPVALVVVSHGAAAALLERQARLCAIQGLDLALLVDAEHHRLLRWVHVEPDHIGQLLHEPRIAGELEATQQVRLELVLAPDPVHGVGTHPDHSRHAPAAPVGGAVRSAVQGGIDDALDRLGWDRRLAPTAGFDLGQGLGTTSLEAIAPEQDRAPGGIEDLGNGVVGLTSSRHQDDAGAKDDALWGVVRANPALKDSALLIGDG